MDIDIVIYAVIAVVLIGRLWTVFGRRNEEDKQRPNPFVTWAMRKDDAETSQVKAEPVSPLLLPIFKSAPDSLAGGLEQIKNRDAGFDEKRFLQQAKLDFTLIVENFAKGDLTPIASLLTPEVLAHFQAAVDARRAAEQVAESTIKSVVDVETSAVRFEGDRARITVTFVSNQENILHDSSGQVIGGEAGRIEEMTDRWTFTRDLSTVGAPWLLAETGA